MASQANRKIATAVVREDADQKQRLLDRAFALAFKGLVYAQIWEDPVVDMEALAIEPGNRIATIASGRISERLGHCCRSSARQAAPSRAAIAARAPLTMPSARMRPITEDSNSLG